MSTANLSEKILIIGPSWVGDMIMAQTLFKFLKQQKPNCIIDLLTPSWSDSLIAHMPEINKHIAMPIGHGSLQFKKRYQIGKQLRKENYSQAIVLPNSWKSGLIPFWAKIPKSTGWLGECRVGLLNDWRKLDKNKLPLMIQRFVALGLNANESLPKELPSPALMVSTHEIKNTLNKFKLDDTKKPIIALCPGAEYGPAKRWPSKYFAEIAQQKLENKWQVWLLGGAKDQPIAQEIQQATNHQCIDLTGQTTLGEVVDLLAVSKLVVSNDSGLMHVACALKRKTVVIYGSSDPRFTPPLSKTARILSLNLACSPCFKRECPLGHTNCLKELTPTRVLTELKELQECAS